MGGRVILKNLKKYLYFSMVTQKIVTKATIVSFIMLALSVTGCGKQELDAQTPPTASPVSVKDLTSSTLQDSSEFIGRLEAKQKVALAPRVDGRIVKIAKQEGDRVKQGDLIVQLQLDREQGEVDAAVADVNIQRANLSNAEAELRAATAEVASAEATVERSRADLRQQEAELELAQTNLERTKFLVKEGAQSTQTLDNRTKDVNTAQAQRDALLAALNASQKALNASRERVSSAQAAVDREQAALNQSQARVAVATQNLDYNRIVAPIDGTIANIVPKVGDYVQAGDNLTTITQNQALEVNMAVPVEQASRLKLGLPVEVTAGRNGKQYKSNISFISPRADSNSQSVLVKAIVDNDGSLQDDRSVRARIIWSQEPGVLIPTEAVSRIAGKSFVFVAAETEQENGETSLIAKQKPVTLGDIQGQNYQVISGIQPGDRLITSGILNLSDGVPITTEPVSSNQR